MTPVQVQLVRETFPAVQEVAGAMTRVFYGRVFLKAPETRQLFHGNIEVQGRKFAEMLTALVDSLPNLERYAVPLRAMGRRHVGYGVMPAYYAVVSEALVWALGQTLESEFTPDVKAAWTALVNEVAALMLSEGQT